MAAQTDLVLSRCQSQIAKCDAEFYELHQLVEEQQKKNEDYGKQLRSAVADRERLQCQTDQLSADNTRLQESKKQQKEQFVLQAQRFQKQIDDLKRATKQ